MPTPKSRDSGRLRLTISTAKTVRMTNSPDGPPLLPWPVAALGGGVAAAIAGMLLISGVVLIAWLSAVEVPLSTVLGFAGQLWLLANGGVLVIGADEVTLVPLGLTLGAAALCASAGRFAYRQGRQARTGELTAADLLRLRLGSLAQVVAGYTASAVVLAGATQGAAQLWRPVLGAFAVSVVGAAVGVLRAEGSRWSAGWPDWLRRGLRGTTAGTLSLLVAAGVALAAAVVLGEPRIADLEEALGFDAGGSLVWALATLAYLPNLLIWALSWVLGAGFTIGTGSLVSLSGTQLGMLPAIPVLGALPPVGASSPWLFAWLLAGVAAGVVAGITASRRGDPGLIGTLAASVVAGFLTGVVYLLCAAASRGGLGSLRLVDLGPRMLEALLIGVPVLTLSAALAGSVAWLIRCRQSAS